MNKFILQILFGLILSISLSAQTNDLQPILIDDFEGFNSENMAAHLDNFVSEISNAPNNKGIVRIYGGNEECFLCRYGKASWIDAYLKNTRKFSSENYSIEYCDTDEKDVRIQLYLLPTAAALPKCDETVTIPKKTVLFDKTYFYFGGKKIMPLEDTRIDVVSPYDGEYSRNILNKVKELLDKSPDSNIYIVVYLGTNLADGYYDEKKDYIEKKIRKLDKKSLAQTLLKNAKNEFIKNGIKAERIKTIEGGYVDDKRKLEFYFVPKNGEIPKPMPDYFPKEK